MRKYLVAIVRYESPLESVRRAVELSHGLDSLPTRARVFIKPNIVFWTRAVPFPKWGVVTKTWWFCSKNGGSMTSRSEKEW